MLKRDGGGAESGAAAVACMAVGRRRMGVGLLLFSLLPLCAVMPSPAVGEPSDPLQVSPDGHWLSFRGRKILLIGDSVTQGWMELGTNFNQNAYVDALANRGINMLMLWTYIGITDQPGDPRIGYDAPEIWPWVQTGGQFNLNQFNDAYFNRLRALVEYAAARNVIVLITVHDGWTKTRFAGHPFNQTRGGPLTANAQYVELHDYANEMPAVFNPGWSRQQKNQYYQERFCERLIQATADQPNVIYEICNEGEWYNQTNFRAYNVHFLAFFKARTPRVTMVNDDHVGGSNFRGEANCDVISYHRPLWDSGTSASDGFNHYAPEFGGAPVKPFYFSEPVPEYQGNAGLHDAIMRLMWGSAVAGAGSVVQNDTSWGLDPSTTMAAQSTNREAVFDLEGHCARFFNHSVVDFSTMAPNGPLASSGVCLADPGREYVVYTQNGGTVTVNLTGSAGEFTARFYNPRTGQFESNFTVVGGGSRVVSKPTTSDWVLHLVQGLPGVRGDFDGDGDLDQADYGRFQQCFSGSGEPITDPSCAEADLDNDGDVDTGDFAMFRGCMTGADIATDPNCTAGP